MKTRVLHYDLILQAATVLAEKIKARDWSRPIFAYGVPRGGSSAVLALRSADPSIIPVTNPSDAQLFVDDLVDSGKTRERFTRECDIMRGTKFATLFTKREKQDTEAGHSLFGWALPAEQWVIFPWEGTEMQSGDDIVLRMLQFIGEDFTRGGLRETPARVLKAWREEWFSGYAGDPKEILKQFEDGAKNYDEMIVVRDIPVYSHCEHHLAPFFGKAHVAYIPKKSIVGLSKLVRLVDMFARRLQVQERLTTQIADAIMQHLSAEGAGVVIECRHLCMESRGVRSPGTSTVTSVMRGAMRSKPEARAELMALIGGQ